MAGISLVKKKWVRLVGRQVPGCLTLKECCLAAGKQVALLDVFEAALGEECGSRSHPEDVFISEVPWKFVRRFDGDSDIQFLADYVSKDPVVLQGYCDRIPVQRFERGQIRDSLCLVQPEDLWWWIREENGKRRNRAVFRLGSVGRVRFDLAVTDPIWLEQLNFLPAGIYSHAFIYGKKVPNTLLTVSLSEPFEGFHYKLVAGVVCLPR